MLLDFAGQPGVVDVAEMDDVGFPPVLQGISDLPAMYAATARALGSPVPQSPTTISRAESLIARPAGRGLNGWLPLAR